MSYYQDGGSIAHLPASTHASYSSRMNSYGSTITSNYSPHPANQHHGVQHQHHNGHHTTNYHPHHNNHHNNHHHQPPPNSGNSLLSLEASRDSLLEAGDLVLNTSSSTTTATDSNNNNSSSSSTTSNRRKPDIGIVVSIISFIVWLRLFQTMFYQSVLGNLEGFIKEFLFVLLVWIPSITLTCFYFRSDDYQRRFRVASLAVGASSGR